MSDMRRVQHRQFGGPEVLELVAAPIPDVPAGHVRVRVRVAALNPVDWKIFTGGPAATARGLTPPLGVGNDIAGVVDAVGEGVAGYAVGDRVFGSARVNAMQDLTLVDPAVEKLAHTPAEVDDATAASLVVAGRTAWAAVDQIGLDQGQALLVHGAAGAVGIFATQLGVARGLRVIGTASEGNHDALRAYGAEPTTYGPGLVDRLRELGGIDGVLDGADGAAVHAGLELGVPVARMVTIAAKDVGGVAGVPTDLGTHGALDELAALAATGDLTIPIAGRYALEEAADAYRLLMDGHVHGKLVVDLA